MRGRWERKWDFDPIPANATAPLAITGLWTTYAVATLIAGIYRRSATVRVLALGLFVLTTGKVFLYDVWKLDTKIRTVAFMGLGCALLLVSFLYRRFHKRINTCCAPGATSRKSPGGRPRCSIFLSVEVQRTFYSKSARPPTALTN